MIYYPYEQFVEDVKTLVEMSASYKPDTIVAVARGGVTLGHAYASATDNRQLMCVNSILYEGDRRGDKCEIFNVPDFSYAQRVLLVDDIIDSGQTMKEIVKHLKIQYPRVQIKTAAIYTKKTAILQADFSLYEADDWIAFFWEKDYK